MGILDEAIRVATLHEARISGKLDTGAPKPDSLERVIANMEADLSGRPIG